MTLSRYLEWRISAQRFDRKPWQLSQEQRASIKAQATRERNVIVAALAAPEASKVHPDPEVVKAAFAAMVQSSGGREALFEDLAQGGLNENAMHDAIAAELKAGLVLDNIAARVSIDEAKVRACYDSWKPRLVLPERRAARHILITINDDYPENSRSCVQQRITQVTEALAAGEDFAELAVRYSECPSALDGGKLGEVRRGQIYPELEQVLFALEPGETRTVESVLGFHLLRCDLVIPPQPISFEAAAPSIRRKLESGARERILRTWLAKRASEQETPGGGT